MSIINLLPEDYLHRGMQRRMRMVVAGLFAVTLTAVVAAALVSEQSSRRTRKVRDVVETSYAQAALQLQQLQDLEGRKQNMLGKAEAISTLLERVPRSHLLGIIANCLPDNASLTRVDLDTKRLVVATPPEQKNVSKFDALSSKTPPKPPDTVVVMDVVGLAGTDVEVAKLIARLARNPLTAAVDLVYSQEKLINKIPVREFQIHVELKGNADAIEDMTESLASAEMAAKASKTQGVD